MKSFLPFFLSLFFRSFSFFMVFFLFFFFFIFLICVLLFYFLSTCQALRRFSGRSVSIVQPMKCFFAFAAFLKCAAPGIESYDLPLKLTAKLSATIFISSPKLSRETTKTLQGYQFSRYRTVLCCV